ncbi:Hsp70 family protein [Arthrobacter pascens]|uniref:Hsp70 family protein n=1 Tax=Arthrobacter pascens TaxID=1677 RepID=UPI003593030E
MNQNAQPVPESLPLGLRGTAVPSVVYYPEEGPILVGEAAERRGLDSPERVVREFKRRVGDAVPIVVGTLSLPAEDVFATVARWVVDRAEEREGAPPSDIILSHPASWGGHRTALILKALARRGLQKVTLISEPEAAALHYASQVRVEDGSTIAVYDLGGGTFDTAVLRKADSSSFELLGRPDGIEGLGGADFDAAVFRHVTEHTGEALTGLDLAAPGALAALSRLRRECVEVKEALSSDTEASISVFLPGVQKQVRLVRSEFEAMIEEPIRETVDALECSLQDLGLDARDLSAVLLIGGSSRIPFVAQLISEQFDRPIAVDADPKSSICLGAAAAALRALPAAEVEAARSVTSAVQPHSALQPHSASQRASWSRKSGSALVPVSVTGAVAGTVARQGSARFTGAKAGAHAPRPVVRATAVAAVAALFTALTATAAQSPDGLGSLTAIFVPPEAGAAGTGSVLSDAGGGAAGGAGAAVAGVGGGTQVPLAGVEASAEKASDQPASAAGIGEAPLNGGAASGSTSEGTGAASSDPTHASGSPAESPTGTPAIDPDPTDPTTEPLMEPVPDPTTEPPAPVPYPTTEPPVEPVPDPTTEPPVEPVPDPTTEPPVEPVPDPTTEPPAPVPDPTTEPPAPVPDPTTEPPAPVPDPTNEPPAPVPDPTNEPPAPVPDPTTEPFVEPVPDPTTEPPPADPAPTTDPPAPTEPAA